MKFLETEKNKLHFEVTNFKQLIYEMKHQESIHLQNPLMNSPTLQSKI